MSKIRCVNKKDGRIQMLSEQVVKIAHFMKKYGWVVEDVKTEDTKPVAKPVEVVAEYEWQPLEEGFKDQIAEEGFLSEPVKPAKTPRRTTTKKK